MFDFWLLLWYTEILDTGIETVLQLLHEPLQWQHWILNSLSPKITPKSAFSFNIFPFRVQNILAFKLIMSFGLNPFIQTRNMNVILLSLSPWLHLSSIPHQSISICRCWVHPPSRSNVFPLVQTTLLACWWLPSTQSWRFSQTILHTFTSVNGWSKKPGPVVSFDNFFPHCF